ncbi:hypothetical protein BTM25_33860 [Actinomadura rubteroloni]|uniref:Uncharacterized protein n=1 Tax=Actinomadura rubteroloni TaxID=1926885 RepID=A0A2P4UIA5_9ACTN|nr:hypothetical protein BTM25_33860 [Actinomadura rubteroloni]
MSDGPDMKSYKIRFTGDTRVLLPDEPFNMFASGELHDYLRMPHDGTRVEIIGGVIHVSSYGDED